MSDDKKEKKQVFKNPPAIQDIQRSLFSNTGLRDQAFKGWETENAGELAVWDIRGGGTARYPKDKQHKIARQKTEDRGLDLIPTPPKLGVSQVKNMDTLGYMLQRVNWLREKAGEPKAAELEFTFNDYAIMRGRTKADLTRGGKFIDELKRDLFTGAYTTYKIDRIEIDGKFYTAHGLPNIYILLEPEDIKGLWKIIYNEPYKKYYLSDGQYYPIFLKAIQDKHTDNQNGYLYFFFKLVMSYASAGSFKTQIKVSTLLDKIKIRDAVKARPQEAFAVLAECIHYTATTYKAITGVCFYDSGRCQKTHSITDLDKFKGWIINQDGFKKEVLAPLGLTDIREALISFDTPASELKKEAEATGQDREIL